MGMSASQARLLALQARQSNLEYQGQQINQERTILSQQCTALYNSLLSMTVPTPPSTSDYTKIEYKGINGAKSFSLGNVTPTDDGLFSIDINYKMTGNCLSTTGKNYYLSKYNVPEKLDAFNIANFKTEINYTDDKKPVEITAQSGSNSVELTTDNLSSYQNKNIMHQVNSENEANAFSGNNNWYYTDEKGNFVKATSYKDAETKANTHSGKVFILSNKNEIETKGPKTETENSDGTKTSAYDWNSSTHNDFVLDDKAGTVKYIDGGIPESAISNYTFYDGSEPPKAIEPKRVGKDVNGDYVYDIPTNAVAVVIKGKAGNNPITNPDYDASKANSNTSINGQIPEKITPEACGSSYNSIMEAIRNSNPEFKLKSDKEIQDAFMIVKTPDKSGGYSFSVVKTLEYDAAAKAADAGDTGRVEVFSIEPNGAYTKTDKTEGCQLTFDTSGRITAIGIPVYDSKTGELKGYDTIQLEAEIVTDEKAYQDAYNEYEYQTYLYDQKNKEINAKTEIIQQEDRNLELKLQRLDNERTQITTEIEAVEKVINDNIESSYKTFSG